MTSALELIRTAQAAGVTFVVTGNDLRLKFSQAPSPELVDELRQSKPAILALLNDLPEVLSAELAPWDHDREERAAVIEYDGGAPRAWAEALARLDPDKPPLDMPPTRWDRFLDDCGVFLDTWAARASELGWEPLHLFGADRTAPYARISRSGLLWIVDGRDIAELDSDRAVIVGRNGARPAFYRATVEPGGAPIWEIAR
jgi:hypothetical protein